MAFLDKEYLESWLEFKSKFFLEQPIFYKNVNSLRFELQAKSPRNFNRIYNFLDSIYNDIIEDDIVFIYTSHNTMFKPNKMDKYYNKTVQLFYEDVYHYLTDDIEDEQYLSRKIYKIESKYLKPDLLLRDLFLEKKNDCNVVIIDLANKRAINIYDKRGMDVIAADVKLLRNIYEKYYYWIIEYDKQNIKDKLSISMFI